MVNTSKILTVSYGTFSCTLEGFDDSFDTMKAIAEYFRDLASDDRYFGAEPPVPDTEMLARIAQRETSRRVVAVEDQGNIVLRAATPEGAAAAKAGAIAQDAVDTAPTQVTPEVTPEIAPKQVTAPTETEIEAVETPVAESATEVAPTEAAPEVVSSEVDAFADFTQAPAPAANSESVAAKLQRIRAVVSKADNQTADDSYNEDEHAVAFLSDTPTAFEPDAPQEDAPEAIMEDDSKDLIEDIIEDAADLAEEPADAVAATDDAAFDVAEEEIEEIAAIESYEDENDDGQISEVLERLSRDTEDADTAESDTAEVALEAVIDAPEADQAEAPVQPEETAAPIEATSIAAIAEIVEAREHRSETDGETDGETAQPRITPQRPRVLKIKRADFEAAVARGQQADENQPQNSAPGAAAGIDSTSLSREDETDLINELAKVEAEFEEDLLDDDFERATAQPEDQDAVLSEDFATASSRDISPAFAPETRTNLGESDEPDLSRILAETNTQMDEPEGKTRRSAIQHLRAAVAATYAEKEAGNDITIKPDTSGAYRDDLASVVRPRRPVSNDMAHTQRARRPAGPGVAPLKLVAEQRVDTEELPARKPIRPRRISLAELAAQSEAATAPADDTVLVDAGSFTDFAEAMGATKLPDLLEAAAAYLSFVEGREKFSRPQLMTKVRQVEQDDFSREDGLRSFGQLLRQGKIQKLKGGRFTVSEQINYKPDERYAG